MNKFDQFSESFSKATGPQINTFAIIFIIIVAAIFVVAIIIYNLVRTRYNFDISREAIAKKRNFFSLGKSIGLEHFEIKALYNLVKKFNVKYPLTCFTNAKVLDDIILKGLYGIEKNKTYTQDEKAANSAILLEIKVNVEKNSRKNTGIRSTRLVSENQKMVIFARDKGYFYAVVKKSINDYIIVSLISQNIIKRIFDKFEFLKIYFWREEDAGYTFETNVIDFEEEIRSYYIKHSDNLVRSQKRKYRRVPVNFNCEISPVKYREINNTKKYYVQKDVIILCSIINLSAGGLVMRFDKWTVEDKIIKIDFKISDYNISGFGKVIRVHKTVGDFREVTAKFIKMNLENKNVINRYVYNYLPGF